MQKAFEKYLQYTCHCSPEKRFLLAISGGIDSVVMAHLFWKSGMECAIAHCNFGLRGLESDSDQQFVEELALKMQIPSYVTRFDTRQVAEEQGISIQMAARDLRYAWFEELKVKHGFDYIAVGHNQNDIVETVLLNLARGSGIRGLSGMKARQREIVRPLLFASRDEIIRLATEFHLQWREDSSNAETKYARNRIRHNIIPEFETINRAFLVNAVETASRLNQTRHLFDFAVNTIKKSVWVELPDKFLIDFEKLQEFPAIETMLYELLKDFGCTRFNIQSLITSFESIPGKRFFTHTHCITRDRNHLIITKIKDPENRTQWIEHETAVISYPIHLTFQESDRTSALVIPAESNFAMLDADKIVYPLLLRPWKQGDTFQPLGMKGTKKISDYLINNKIPLPDKQRIWIIESGGLIAWIVNHRIDDRFRISQHTSKILQIEYKSETSNA
jgi:tRNA(Ile)-lysidine synthase